MKRAMAGFTGQIRKFKKNPKFFLRNEFLVSGPYISNLNIKLSINQFQNRK